MDRPDNIRQDDDEQAAKRHADTQRASAARLAKQTRAQFEASRAALDREQQAAILRLNRELGYGRRLILATLSPSYPTLTEYRIRRLLSTAKADSGGFITQLTPDIISRR